MDAFVSSCNKKKKELRKWILKNIISQCLTQQVLEEKDTVLALFNDDIKGLDNKIKTVKHKDFRFEGKIHAKHQQIGKYENSINHLRNGYVNHARNSGLGNVVMVVHKHASKDNGKNFDYPCYIACIQRRAITIKRGWLQEKFPGRKEIVVTENPNSLDAFNCFYKKDHIERYKHQDLLIQQGMTDMI